jgi:hypothetical protein
VEMLTVEVRAPAAPEPERFESLNR